MALSPESEALRERLLKGTPYTPEPKPKPNPVTAMLEGAAAFVELVSNQLHAAEGTLDRDGEAAIDRIKRALADVATVREHWPLHQPAAPDAPIPGRHWWGGCDDSKSRVDPFTGVCEGCGGIACPDCGAERYPDGGCQCRTA